MAKNVRISDTLYRLALAESDYQERSIAQQIEYWAKLGLMAAAGDAAAGENERFIALMGEVAKTRELDRQDVREGRMSSQALSWFKPGYVASLKLDIPEYR